MYRTIKIIPYLILPVVIIFYMTVTFILGLFFSPSELALSYSQPNNALSSIFVYDKIVVKGDMNV